MAVFDWSKLEEAKADLLKRAAALKQAFVQMPGGAPAGDPAAGGAPMDPAMMGGAPMDPAMAGGMPPPGDPAAGGAPMDPAMAGMDPAMMSMMGGVPPMGVDPATAGMLGGMSPDAGAGAATAGASATPEPTITVTLSQLWDIVNKMLGLAKKIGANGQGVTPEAPSQPAGGVSQDAIKAAVIEALGDMGAMR